MRMLGVEILDGSAAFHESAGFFQLRPDSLNAIRVFHRLPVVRDIALAIKVALAHHLGRQRQPPRRLLYDLFDHQHPLRTAESAERRLRSFVRQANVSRQISRRQQVRVVGVKQGARQHRVR